MLVGCVKEDQEDVMNEPFLEEDNQDEGFPGGDP